MPPFIETAIALIYIYLIFSLCVSSITEFVGMHLQWRGKQLKRNLLKTLDVGEVKWGTLLYVHPAIQSMVKTRPTATSPGALPAYLPSGRIADALLDLVLQHLPLRTAGAITATFQDVVKGVEELPESEFKTLMALFIRTVEGRPDEFAALRAEIATWFDEMTDRMTGWYKRWVRVRLVVVGMAVAVAFNVDTFTLVDHFTKSPALREAVNQAAAAQLSRTDEPGYHRTKSAPPAALAHTAMDTGLPTTDTPAPETETALAAPSATKTVDVDSLAAAQSVDKVNKRFKILESQLAPLALPIGWIDPPRMDALHWGMRMLGWLLTGLALSFGAPFWFDVLKTIVNVRSAGLVPKKQHPPRITRGSMLPWRTTPLPCPTFAPVLNLAKRLYATLFLLVFLLFFVSTYPLVLVCLLVPALHTTAHRIRRWWPWVNYPLLGLFFRPMGPVLWDREAAVVVVANHTAFIDIPTILATVPNRLKFMAKKSLADIPLFGIWFKRLDISVDRKSRMSSYRAFEEATEALKNGWSVVNFPEGTIAPNAPIIGKFKNGAFRMAIQAQVPIVPLTILDNWARMPPQDNFLMTPGNIRIVRHAPISTIGLTLDDEPALREQVRNLIVATFVHHNPQFAGQMGGGA